MSEYCSICGDPIHGWAIFHKCNPKLLKVIREMKEAEEDCFY